MANRDKCSCVINSSWQMLIARFRRAWIWFIVGCILLVRWSLHDRKLFSEKPSIQDTIQTTLKPKEADLPQCWTDTDYQQWKEGKFYPVSQPKGSIVYMVMTGDTYLRTRCDVMMCTFGVTLHPSRLFFVGETSSDSRLPIYDVVKRGTPRPVSRPGSMQKLGGGLAMLVKKINQSSDYHDVEWIMVMDDDTFVLPLNLRKVVSEYDSRRPLIIGKATCGVGFCGGAGYVISKGLFIQLPSFIQKCQVHDDLHQSDQFVPSCIKKKVKVEFVDRKEFHHEAPGANPTEYRYRDHPDGLGHAVSYHYIRPAQKYLDLWRLKQAYI